MDVPTLRLRVTQGSPQGTHQKSHINIVFHGTRLVGVGYLLSLIQFRLQGIACRSNAYGGCIQIQFNSEATAVKHALECVR
jgi:hypothetical protein